MEIKQIKTENAPQAIGPYSQGISVGETVYISGQLPVNPETGNFDGDTIELQAKRSLENIKAILNEIGLDMSNVVKTTVLMKDLKDFVAMNEIYSSYFSEPYPARSTFQVAALPKDALVEIEVVAIK